MQAGVLDSILAHGSDCLALVTAQLEVTASTVLAVLHGVAQDSGTVDHLHVTIQQINEA